MTLNTLELIFKLFLACILGGVIGLERESVNRPAGFRTHILVSVGSTIVMITNMELVRLTIDQAAGQPGRFGAAVISGIGFLGAGTIIKEGSTVKGLTTAASLWTTACIGLALGTGLYAIALVGTLFVFLTLEFFPKIERKISAARGITHIEITARNQMGQLSKISQSFSQLNIIIMGVKTIHDEDNQDIIILLFNIKCPTYTEESAIIEKIMTIDGVEAISLNSI